jgi:hypothetical protein
MLQLTCYSCQLFDRKPWHSCFSSPLVKNPFVLSDITLLGSLNSVIPMTVAGQGLFQDILGTRAHQIRPGLIKVADLRASARQKH